MSDVDAAERGDAPGAWADIYANGAPPEDGRAAAAQVRAGRQVRRRIWLGLVTAVAALVAIAYLVVPKWIYSADAYSQHVSGAYADQLPASLRADIDRTLPGLVHFVEQRRGHRFQSTPELAYLPPAQFADELHTDTAFIDTGAIGGPTAYALGWASGPGPLDDARVALQTAGISAFYGPFDGKVYLSGEHLDETARAELVAALTEALDGSMFATDVLLAHTDHDRRMAVRALIEGDGAAAEVAWIDRLAAGRRCAVAATAHVAGVVDCPAPGTTGAMSPAMAALTMFPRWSGPGLIDDLLRRGGPRRLDAAFDVGPQSSLNVLSPATFTSDVSPQVLTYPAHEGALVDFGVLGDAGIAFVAGRGAAGSLTSARIDGWRGDAYSTFTTDGRTCVRDTLLLSDAGFAAKAAARLRGVGATAAVTGSTVTWNLCRA